LAIEVAELQELFLWASAEQEAQILDTRRDEVRDELADVVITAMNFALAVDIDVAAAVWSKIHQNEERYPVEKARGRATKYTHFDEGPR
jgi:dCTP diphosphatase